MNVAPDLPHDSLRDEEGTLSPDVLSTSDQQQQARDLLEQHPHFCGHSKEIKIAFEDGRLMLSGRLPSFYLKQQLQEVVRCIEGVDRIENRVVVVCADGISSTHDQT